MHMHPDTIIIVAASTYGTGAKTMPKTFTTADFEFPIPSVGDGATYSIGSDRYAATVVKVEISKSGKTITVTIQDDNREAAPGSNYYGKQEYIYTPNPNGSTMRVRYNDRIERWVEVGQKGYGRFVTFGHRSAYSDPSF